MLMLVSFVVPASSASAQAGRLCFNVPAITNCIEGRFREYWEQNGGLPVFGYPTTPAANTRTGEGTFLTQTFERNTFELHPEKPRPYDVLLGRLGDAILRSQGTIWQTLPKAAPAAPHYFPETGHAVSHEPFWQYWSARGLQDPALNPYQRSLALFGLPISEAFTARNPNGDTVLMQWFERARFEWHPNNAPQYQVLLGLLGNEFRSAPVPPAPPAPDLAVEGPARGDFVRAPFRLHGRMSRFPAEGLLYYRLTNDDGDELVENWFEVRRAGNGATFDTIVSFREPADYEGLNLEVTERDNAGRRLTRVVVPLRFDPTQVARQEIIVDAPARNAAVKSPIRLRGRTLRAPVGNVLHFRMVNDDGDVVARGRFAVTRSGAGSAFDTTFPFTQPRDTEIFDLHVEEHNAQGNTTHRTTVRVRFEP
jgi:hypothetical protein